jgi:hypothetical protein
VQATSTMNQSDIRGLSLWTEPTLIFSVMSYAFYNREFSSVTAYRSFGSHIALIVPAPVSANPYFQFLTIKEQLRRRGDKRNILITPLSSFFESHIQLTLTI